MKKIIKNILSKLGYKISKIQAVADNPIQVVTVTPSTQNQFWHYCSSFNPIELVNKFKKDSLVSSPKHLTNFLGVKIRPEFFPTLPLVAGEIDPAPMPNNFHADLAEWGSCLRAVELAENEFSMLELGCGWGCWMNNLGIAAKSAGKTISLYGVEGDEGHISFATKALADNGIQSSEYKLFHGIAGKKSSIALFPKLDSGADWGGIAKFNLTPDEAKNEIATGKYVQLPVIDINEIFKLKPALDIVHLDIQGAELDLVAEIFDFLNAKAKSVFIGTHSKQIEGGLYDLFLSNDNWDLEMERPNIHMISNGKPINIVDGVQYWRNRALA